MNFFMVFLLLTSVFCNTGKVINNSPLPHQESKDIMELVDSVTRKSIIVKSGEVFAFELPSNPSTGYEWVVNRNELKNVEHVDKEEYGRIIAPKSRLDGAPGKQVFNFKAKGEDTVTFIYRRAWEPNDRSTLYKLKLNVE
eukprot:TRINITY_DN8061_c0_g2_i1.p1 TRINITY_DN8061_c0_g2~~TRINITY_DN8061_c0_g2_i1.p1  ORF type:complete len:140 (+),score=26.72 TRINITY_DN8061_c0_g2_i1:171-590(+)